MSKKGVLLYDTQIFIEKAKNVHGDRFSYEKTVYKGRNENRKRSHMGIRDKSIFHNLSIKRLKNMQ